MENKGCQQDKCSECLEMNEKFTDQDSYYDYNVSDQMEKDLSVTSDDMIKVQEDIELNLFRNTFSPDEILLEGLKRIENNYFGRIRTIRKLEAAHVRTIREHFKSERISAHHNYQAQREQLFTHFRNTFGSGTKCEECKLSPGRSDGLVSPIYERQFREEKPNYRERTVPPICLVRIKSDNNAEILSNPENGESSSSNISSGQSHWCVKQKPKAIHLTDPCILYARRDEELLADLAKQI